MILLSSNSWPKKTNKVEGQILDKVNFIWVISLGDKKVERMVESWRQGYTVSS